MVFVQKTYAGIVDSTTVRSRKLGLDCSPHTTPPLHTMIRSLTRGQSSQLFVGDEPSALTDCVLTEAFRRLCTGSFYRPQTPAVVGFIQANSVSLPGEIKSHFSKSIHLLALRVSARDIGQLKKSRPSELSDCPLQARRVSSVIKDPSKESRDDSSHATPIKLLLLSASVRGSACDRAIDHLRAKLRARRAPSRKNYDWFSEDDVLSSLLPLSDSYCTEKSSSSSASGGTPTRYAMIRHIAHLNLSKAFLPYKCLRGQVILDKNRPKI